MHDLGLGGTERVAIRLANAWTRLGCRVLLCAGDGRGVQRALVAPEVEVLVAEPPIGRSLLSRWRLRRWFAGCCARAQPAVVFLPGNFYFLAAPVLATHAPVFAKISNALWRPDRHAWRNHFFATLTRWRLRRAAGVIALSPALMEEARAVLGPAMPLVQLPNPALEALPVLDESRRRRWHLCAVGRLVPQKNLPLLLHAMACLSDVPVTLDILGDGELRGSLEQLARQLGITARVRFAGTVGDVQQRLAEADAMLLTSDFEGYPGVVVEALAAGTYVVARDCSPSIRELLPDRGIGTVVEGDDPRAFAQAVREYLVQPRRDVPRMRSIAGAHLVDEVARRYLAVFGLSSAGALDASATDV
jgi:glycosyltransferase involved in cell wall biosynthesis